MNLETIFSIIEILKKIFSGLFKKITDENILSSINSLILYAVIFICGLFLLLLNPGNVFYHKSIELKLEKSISNLKNDSTFITYKIQNSNIFILKNKSNLEPVKLQIDNLEVEHNELQLLICTFLSSLLLFLFLFLFKLKKHLLLIGKSGPQPELKNCTLKDQCLTSIREIFLEKYTHSALYLVKEICKYKSHDLFITEFKNATGITPIKLIEIEKLANRSKGGKFLCVVSNQCYFDNPETPNSLSQVAKTLIRYFSNFQAAISNNNQILRIFSLQANSETHHNELPLSNYSDTSQYRNIAVFQYLIFNKVIGIDTYLHIYRTNSIKSYPDIDYVLGYPSILGDENKPVLYLSYDTNDNQTAGDDLILSTYDNLFIKIIEDDFRKRYSIGSDRTEEGCRCIKFPDLLKINKNIEDYKLILKMLRMDKSEAISVINKLICFISTTSEPIPNSTTIIKKLKNWADTNG